MVYWSYTPANHRALTFRKDLLIRKSNATVHVPREGRAPYTKEERKRSVNLKRLYGITLADYEATLEGQDGVCAICHCAAELFYVDHNHLTGQVRGLLCPTCNSALGYVREDPAFVRELLAYIYKWQYRAERAT